VHYQVQQLQPLASGPCEVVGVGLGKCSTVLSTADCRASQHASQQMQCILQMTSAIALCMHCKCPVTCQWFLCADCKGLGAASRLCLPRK
jgi:hypothetical protein